MLASIISFEVAFHPFIMQQIEVKQLKKCKTILDIVQMLVI